MSAISGGNSVRVGAGGLGNSCARAGGAGSGSENTRSVVQPDVARDDRGFRRRERDAGGERQCLPQVRRRTQDQERQTGRIERQDQPGRRGARSGGAAGASIDPSGGGWVEDLWTLV